MNFEMNYRNLCLAILKEIRDAEKYATGYAEDEDYDLAFRCKTESEILQRTLFSHFWPDGHFDFDENVIGSLTKRIAEIFEETVV